MKKYASFLLFCLLTSPALVAQGQDDLDQDPGYVDVQTIEEWFDAEPNIEVNVQGALLELVAEASRESNPEMADLLNKLKAIQVRGFTEGSFDRETIQERTQALAEELENRGWLPAVHVREEGENVNMYLREENGTINGLMVMVAQPEESIFVNIVGPIDPAQIGRLGRAFDIDPLKDLPAGADADN